MKLNVLFFFHSFVFQINENVLILEQFSYMINEFNDGKKFLVNLIVMKDQIIRTKVVVHLHTYINIISSTLELGYRGQ